MSTYIGVIALHKN